MTPELFFHNSASNGVEKFEPIDPRHIRMYVCGPTVYDHIHVGNARPVVVFDTLFRLLNICYPNSKVTYVRNITDIDDKIIERARENNVTITSLTETTTQSFLQCCTDLATLPPSFQPKATAYIKEMIALVTQLIERDRAYVAGDGHVLCAVDKDADYGKLSGRIKEEQLAGARVSTADYKRHPSDFILWKPSETTEPGWESPWGRGRPGWHTECVAMSSGILGFDFDIHGGGIDLLFPHHENELCQCRGLSPDYNFAKYWLHNGYVVVDGEKMSKSLGNFVFAKDLIAEYGANVVRIALLMTHYRKPLNMSKQRLLDAQNFTKKFQQAWQAATELGCTTTDTTGKQPQVGSSLLSALASDLDTYAAINHLQQYAASCIASPKEHAQQFVDSTQLLGLAPPQQNPLQQAQIQALLQKRETARQQRDFATADAIRAEIEQTYHVEISDHTGKASTWKRK